MNLQIVAPPKKHHRNTRKRRLKRQEVESGARTLYKMAPRIWVSRLGVFRHLTKPLENKWLREIPKNRRKNKTKEPKKCTEFPSFLGLFFWPVRETTEKGQKTLRFKGRRPKRCAPTTPSQFSLLSKGTRRRTSCTICVSQSQGMKPQ